MAAQGDIGRQIMEIVIRSPGRDMEDLVSECRHFTGNQVFVELDHLGRPGRIIFKQKGRGTTL